jgi:membrane associated rhomboid family serine protease
MNGQVVTPTVRVLIFINVAVFLLQNLSGDSRIIVAFALWPQPDLQPWQLVSYAFLHGNLPHLFFNMFALWMFGSDIERLWGARRFTIYYFTAVIGAALMHLLAASYSGVHYPTVGASGGVFGILLAFGLLFPNRMVVLLIPPIPMKAKYFVLLYGVLEFWLGVSGAQTGVAHFAHLGGMLFGLLLLLYWRSVR